jgi:hypothetical protein
MTVNLCECPKNKSPRELPLEKQLHVENPYMQNVPCPEVMVEKHEYHGDATIEFYLSEST